MGAAEAAARLADWLAELLLQAAPPVARGADPTVAARVVDRWQRPGWFLPGGYGQIRWLLAAAW